MANSKSIRDADRFRIDSPHDERAPAVRHESDSDNRQLDVALDTALCSVSLPEGLIMRLGLLVRKMPNESADPVDWLGC